MSLWPVVISLLFGILASAFVPVSLVWILSALFVFCVLVLAAYFVGWNTKYLFLLCCVFLGWSDAAINQQFFGEPEELPLQHHYRAPTPPSLNVVRLESLLARSALSQEHRNELHAMMFADRTQLSKEQRTSFRLAGAQHLLALSGTHLGILLAICYFLFLRHVRYSRFRWPVMLGVLCFLWYYTFMVGAPNSLRRAMLMATLFLLGQAMFRSTRSSDILATTIFFMSLIDPLCVFDIGAELSVAAVVGIIFIFPLFYAVVPNVSSKIRQTWNAPKSLSYKCCKWLWGLFCVSLSTWLMTMPLVLFYFGQLQFWPILTGVVLVPATMLILYFAVFVLLLCAIGWSPLILFFSDMLERMMDCHDWLLARCGELPFAWVRVQPISFEYLLILYALVLNIWAAWANPTRRFIYRCIFYSFLLLVLLYCV